MNLTPKKTKLLAKQNARDFVYSVRETKMFKIAFILRSTSHLLHAKLNSRGDSSVCFSSIWFSDERKHAIKRKFGEKHCKPKCFKLSLPLFFF